LKLEQFCFGWLRPRIFWKRVENSLQDPLYKHATFRCKAVTKRYMFCQSHPGPATSPIRIEDSIRMGSPFNSTSALSRNKCYHINLTTPQKTLVTGQPYDHGNRACWVLKLCHLYCKCFNLALDNSPTDVQFQDGIHFSSYVILKLTF
jgi:hypothetical protein